MIENLLTLTHKFRVAYLLHVLKQVISLDKVELGYLPRQISAHLSILLDKELGCLVVRYLRTNIEFPTRDYCLSHFLSDIRLLSISHSSTT